MGLTLCNRVDCSTPGFPVHLIFNVFVEFVIILLLFCFGFLATRHVGSSPPDRGFNPQPLDRKARSSPWDHWEAPYNFYILHRRLARMGGKGRRGEKEAASGHHGCWRRGIESPEDQSMGWGGPPGVSGPRADRLRLVQRPLSLFVPQRRPGAALLRPGSAPGSWSERRRPHERPGWGCPLSSLTPLLPPGHQQGFLGDWRLLCSWPEGCL